MNHGSVLQRIPGRWGTGAHLWKIRVYSEWVMYADSLFLRLSSGRVIFWRHWVMWSEALSSTRGQRRARQNLQDTLSQRWMRLSDSAYSESTQHETPSARTESAQNDTRIHWVNVEWQNRRIFDRSERSQRFPILAQIETSLTNGFFERNTHCVRLNWWSRKLFIFS